jgi:hypothetical protein
MIDAAGQAQLILDEACIRGYVETGDKSLSKSIGILIGSHGGDMTILSGRLAYVRRLLYQALPVLPQELNTI